MCLDFDRNNPEEQSSSSIRKIIDFDSNYDSVSVQENTDSLPEKESNESEGDSITSSVGSYPRNHRYQNYQDIDNEIEELYDSDFNDDVEKQEDYNDYDADIDDKIIHQDPNKEPKPIGKMSGNVRDRSPYFHSVLNPIENLTQWKAVKSKGTLPLNSEKENFGEEEGLPRISFSSEPSFKQSLFSFKSKSHQPKNPNQEIPVDASLSSWLASTETCNTKKSMFQSIEDRPILGALTLEELRQFSVSNSPRKSPSRSPEEMPIIGTVGTYWSHTGSTSS